MEKHRKTLSKKASVSVHVEILGKGTPLYSFSSDNQLIPASNAKLVTSVVALEQLGPAFSFETKVYSENENLIVEGSGDPYIVSERLWLLARDIARTGIKKVKSIVINNAQFGDDYQGLMDWSESGEPYTAMVSGTSLNFNSLEIHLVPDGKKIKVEVAPYPHNYAKILNEVKVVSGSRKNITAHLVNKAPPTIAISGTMGREASS